MLLQVPFMFMFILIIGIGTLFSVSSSHWMGIWGGLEINLIGFLPLLVSNKKLSESESAMKYLITQALGSGLLIFSSLILFSLTFSWEVKLIWANFVMMILFSSLLIKMGVFPFHFWLPSVMAGLSWLMCLILSTWQKVAPLFLLNSMMELSMSNLVMLFIGLCCVGSALIGGVGGINQTQLRALLAYSSIGHLGWLVFAAYQSSLILKSYFLFYILISLFVFKSLWATNISNTKHVNSLGKGNFYSILIGVSLLSLGGLPPLLGFIPKLSVMMVTNSNLVLFLMLMVLGSLMSLFYYLNLFFSLSMTWDNLISFNWSFLKSDLMMTLILLLNLLGGSFLMNTILLDL